MSEISNVLVTGGAGYIGSHTVKQLKERNLASVAYDNLAQGHRSLVLADDFVQGDLSQKGLLKEVIEEHRIDAVMHFAAHCRVGESVSKPEKYYENNLVNGLNLLETMVEEGVKYLIFSSSAAIYGEPEEIPIPENHGKSPESPYGRTKWLFEQLLPDYGKAHGLKAASLRYFNAAGSDPEGEIGEMHDPETHLIPIVLEVAAGEREEIEIFGTDYDTADGTCIRDYIHVNDLASAHIKALEKLTQKDPGTIESYNLGTGNGYSVRQVIEKCREVTGREIPATEGERRAGDPPVLIADPSRAKEELDWEPKTSSLENIVETAWRWKRSLD